jgi:hypothetical protein
MNSHNGPVAPGPGAKIIPLQPGIARPTTAGGSGGSSPRVSTERRAQMRDAVLQVVHHLVLEAVPPGDRSPLFGQAADLLDLAGWGLDELYEASRDGPARDDLLHSLGLSDT